MKTLIVDYGMGNLQSLYRAVEENGGHPFISQHPSELRNASKVILPGVGAFSNAMKNLKEKGWVDELNRVVKEGGVPLLGVCLGMQLLSDKGHENKLVNGLGFIKGDAVKLIPATNNEKIPHVGWNEVNLIKEHWLFNNIDDNTDFYFVHSYSIQLMNSNDVIALTPYCGTFVSAVANNNILGVQFHPEKSSKSGLRLLENFLKYSSA
jgi:glutamine amidotransferase